MNEKAMRQLLHPETARAAKASVKAPLLDTSRQELARKGSKCYELPQYIRKAFFMPHRRSTDEGNSTDRKATEAAIGRGQEPIHEKQYPIIAARRQAYDTMLWQTPAAAVAAQAFLLGVVLNPETNGAIAMTFSIVAILVSISSLVFFDRTRFMEVYDSELLRQFEASKIENGYRVVHGRRSKNVAVPTRGLAHVQAFIVWRWLLILFVLLCALASIRTGVGLFATDEIKNNLPILGYDINNL